MRFKLAGCTAESVLGSPYQPLYSPFNGKPVVYWRLVVEEEFNDDYTTSQHVLPKWRTIYKENVLQDFWLQDGQHRVLVKGGDLKSVGLAVGNLQKGSNFANYSTFPPGINQIIAG